MICSRSRLISEPWACRAPGIAAASVANANGALRRRPDRGARIVSLENRSIILTGARATDRAPLTHADTMPIAHPVERETRERAVGRRRRCDGKIGALENLATGLPQHESNVVAAQHEVPTI